MKIYDRFITGLAALGALSLAGLTCAIVLDVILRNTGHRPFQSTSALSEYAMMFSTMCAAPWLVREQGHVAISAFASKLPGAARRVAGVAIQAIAVVTLGVLGWRAGVQGWDRMLSGALDMRSISIPSWVLYAMLCGGFSLTAIEFLRQILRGELYTGGSGGH